MSSAAAPLFSVVVAVYNAEQYLEETLRALQAQTFADFEVLMVDDGSVDRSAEIARQFCQSDSRFQLWQTPNRGISPTRNLAVQRASGPWIAVCDADDTWEPGKLEAQHRFIVAWAGQNEEELVALGTAGDHINAAGQPIRPLHPRLSPWPSGLQDESLLEDLHMINSSVVFRRDVFEAVGGYRAEYTPTEDTDLWVRLSERGAVVNLQEPLTHYRIHGTNVSEQHYMVMVLNMYRIRANAERRRLRLPEWTAQEFKAQLRLNSRQYRMTMTNLRHMMYYNKGKNRWSNGHPLSALGALLMSFVVAPRKTAELFSHSRVLRSRALPWRKSTR
ncbi:glycosyltransferase family 2 protein [Deinococcus oregonensis]|uniref:Glycosyltransferase family 2 protein n=1 Tax=Deinococcus oregonensis TaxID=1805970 RepID=A0ABV6AUZ0_9DEIO